MDEIKKLRDKRGKLIEDLKKVDKKLTELIPPKKAKTRGDPVVYLN